MTINEIKKALDDLVEEKENLEDKIYKLEEKLKNASRIIRQCTFTTHKYVGEKETFTFTQTTISEDTYNDLLEILEK